jgi:hypothetical protein
MEYQIEINFSGRYRLDDGTEIENPLVIGASANDDLIETVFVGVYFTSPTYYLSRSIGSFDYVADWSNADVISLINGYMDTHKIL